MEGHDWERSLLGEWVHRTTPLTATETSFSITFNWDHSTMGVPGAFIIRNHHHSQFYLKTLTLDDFPGHGRIHFICNSWVYPAHRYKYDRVFFSNKTYLPCQTPEPLRQLREQELINLRGNGKGQLKEWDRVYDYAYYNDLGSPDKGEAYARPVLGGSKEYPYPRRGRTGRKPTKKDPKSESRLPLLSLDIYVPRDERFGHVKFSDFLAYALKSIAQVLLPEISSICDKTINEFDCFEDVFDLYNGGIKLPGKATVSKVRNRIPWELLKELVRNDGERFLKFPIPEVIKEDKSAWRTDEEFAREMLAGVNPVIISRLQVRTNISHWLNTHAVIEPFIIATNRQLSVLHPIHKLLQPHFRDTMNINALARQILINAGGMLEITVFPARYSMEMSAVLYKNWVFTEQALPADLIKR
ncbi:unnamed protein product [Linum tenue]|uniref:Lipoxygenase n=1 Tax=Linum tenue TaxID=586396 RepID=A0AAV0L5A9_9ROSI|nr:unnamed protein product [Linum tenue]